MSTRIGNDGRHAKDGKFTWPSPPARDIRYTLMRAAARPGDFLRTLYEQDLTVHDKAALARYPVSRPLAWAVHPSGTHLYYPGVMYGSGRYARPAHVCMGYALEMYPDAHCYFWDGTTLARMTRDDLVHACTQAEEIYHAKNVLVR